MFGASRCPENAVSGANWTYLVSAVSNFDQPHEENYACYSNE
jgi:hypothetical protein